MNDCIEIDMTSEHVSGFDLDVEAVCSGHVLLILPGVKVELNFEQVEALALLLKDWAKTEAPLL